MEKVDGRSLAPKAQERIRRLAVKAVLDGARQVEVAKLYGITRRAVAKWLKSYRDGGFQALAAKPQGQPEGGSLLPWQSAQIAKTVVDHHPEQLKLPFYLWTREAVAKLIQRGVEQAEAAGVPLDRDIVVRWSVCRPEPGLQIESARGPDDETYALVTVVPPSPLPLRAIVARDVVLLLDVSGSMQGEPIAQAKRVVAALVSTLGEQDSLEMIAFASSAKRWRRGVARTDAAARRDALEWLAALTAGGGTEMRNAIEAALAPLRADPSARSCSSRTDRLASSRRSSRRSFRGCPRALACTWSGSARRRTVLSPRTRRELGEAVRSSWALERTRSGPQSAWWPERPRLWSSICHSGVSRVGND